MHENSLIRIREFADSLPKDSELVIYDIGSLDVNGSYKPIFTNEKWKYFGLDVAPGKNVDIIIKNPYDWGIPDESCNVLVSGQTLEHVEYPWVFMQSVHKVLKYGGLCCIIAPAYFITEHRFPLDCYRFLFDGMMALTRWAKLNPIGGSFDSGSFWGDCCIIARKERII